MVVVDLGFASPTLHQRELPKLLIDHLLRRVMARQAPDTQAGEVDFIVRHFPAGSVLPIPLLQHREDELPEETVKRRLQIQCSH